VIDTPGEVSTSTFPVIGELVTSDSTSLEPAAQALNSCDVAIVQHEYGLYGGRDGADVLKVLHDVRVPSIAILHTVLSKPTSDQIQVLNEVIKDVDAVVVMTEGAATTLRSVHELGDTRLRVIPHGARVSNPTIRKSAATGPRVLTWGLIGPGKGIEWVIDAMARLKDLWPSPEYLVAGPTHPKVLAVEGDVYRQSLVQRVAANGVGEMVSFDNSYRDLHSLNELIASADVVVLPYDSMDQATSGVLVDAVAAGRPVIATGFPHAAELLADGAGIIVPHRDSGALATAIGRVLTDPQLASDMVNNAHRLASSLSWPVVGAEYEALTNELLARTDVLA
jgi:glycosyltransferase involved in cell wall biosynthesis